MTICFHQDLNKITERNTSGTESQLKLLIIVPAFQLNLSTSFIQT
jgi:hypothetical protein